MKQLPEKLWYPSQANPALVVRARELRKTMTRAETILWKELRSRQFRHWKFRRQHPIGRFIVDFYSNELKLALEVDGSVHDHRTKEDAERESIIETNGIRMIRFENEEIENNLLSALQKIAKAVEEKL